MFTFGTDIVALPARVMAAGGDDLRPCLYALLVAASGRLDACWIAMVAVPGGDEAAIGPWAGCRPAGYGGAAARLARVWRRRFLILGGSPAAARLLLSAWRVSKACRM